MSDRLTPSSGESIRRHPTPEHIRKMQAGRRRVQQAREREAIQRVLAWQKWLKAGSVIRDIPDVPTDGDYAIARTRGEI